MKRKKIDLEDIFLAILGQAKRLKWFLQYKINIANYLDAKYPKHMALADITLVAIPKDKIQEFLKDINKERILKVFEKERPDLYKIINTDKGLTWLEEQIKNFKERFL